MRLLATVTNCFFSTSRYHFVNLNPIQDGSFRGYSRKRWRKMVLLHKNCYTYPVMVKLCTVIPYLKKIQKICESHDTPLALIIFDLVQFSL